MKRVIPIVTILLSVAALVVADPPAAEESDEKVSLRMIPEAGSYVMAMRTESSQVMSSPAMPAPQRGGERMTMTMRMDVSEPNEEGERTMAVTFARIENVMRQGNRVVARFDSNDPPDEQDPGMAKGFRPLLGAELVFTLDADGEVTEVDGVDALWEAYAKEFEGMPMADEVMKQIKQAFGDEALAKMVRPGQQVIPKEPVGEGHTWKLEQQLPVPFVGKMTVRTTNRLESIENREGRKVATINVQGDFSADEPEKEEGVMGLNVESAEGDQTGTYVMDLDSGLVLEMDMSQDLTLKATMTDPRTGEETTMTLEQRSEMSATMSRVEEEDDGEE